MDSSRPLPAGRWSRVKELFHGAMALSPAERAAHLQAIEADVAVRDEVLALLEAHDTSEGFLEPPERPLLDAGRRLGPYEIRGHLGGGGMGDVYRAHDTRLGRDVAVKVLRDLLVDESARARFQREARVIAALSHPNVIAIHDVGDDSGVPFLVTELLDGETLRGRLRRGALPCALALEWAVEMANGLAAAHDEGLVHRDLKPENVFLLSDGRVKILDFGLARAAPGGRRAAEDVSHTLPGLIVGTAAYLAPEQARGLATTAPSDLFALGTILFEMLTGSRAFRGDTPIDILRAVVTEDPPAPSTLRPEVPRWVDRVVARCLAKDPLRRFQSARDLAFALAAPPVEIAPRPSRARRWLPAVALAGVAAGALGAAAIPRSRGADRGPARPRALTFSGHDSDPAVSLDGKFLAVALTRDGRSRIWLQQLAMGRETALTDGPDEAPRFSPDGAQLLFTRVHGRNTSVHRVGILGGEVQLVIDDATNGDWSPDGKQVVFVRWQYVETRAWPTLMIAGADGSGARELVRLDYRLQVRPRWSPDGKTIAVTGFGQLPGTPQAVMLVPVDGSPPRVLPAPSPNGLVSGVAWEGPGALLYSQALSVTGNWAGGGARIVRQRVDDGTTTTLLWNLESSFVLDRWPGRGVVFDARSTRQNLREVALAPGSSSSLSSGIATDRQPVYSRDGAYVAFSSNRNGNLDVLRVERRTGTVQRLTDHSGEDWDPAFTPDGRHLLWSSNRGGTFEVWMADADGARPRQVTRDGDGENPTATPDGRWILYASGAAGRAGIWRIRPDGTEPTLLVPNVILPETSPDGEHVLFQRNLDPRLAVVGVARVADGQVLPFEIRIALVKTPSPALGRARWMPDGRAIAYLGQDERGRTGVFVQRFSAGEDTGATRAPLAGFGSERVTESFGIAPDAGHVVLAEWEQGSTVVAATAP